MHRARLQLLRLGAVAQDGLVLALLWLALSQLRAAWSRLYPLDLLPSVHVLRPLDPSAQRWVVALVVPVWLLCLAGVHSYRALRRKPSGRIGSEVFRASGLALLITLSLLFLGHQPAVSRSLLLGFTLCAAPSLWLSRLLQQRVLQRLRRTDFDPHRLLVFGSSSHAAPLLDTLRQHPDWGIQLVDTVRDLPNLRAVLQAQQADEVYLAGTPDPVQVVEIARLCTQRGVVLSLDANFLGLHTQSASLADFDGWSVLSFARSPTTGHSLKRALDLVGAGLGLLALSPLLLAVAALIKLSDGGPVFFIQDRAGRYGRTFRMLKFRTMVPDAEAQRAALQRHNELSGPCFKMAQDPRITQLGRWLRRSSIDELPQLLNVLRGEMSLVGPRPHLVHEVAGYERWQLRRLSMAPGLTCSWQVSGRSGVDFDEWVRLDLDYIDHWSLWLDLSLILRTVPAVLRGTGAW